MLILKHLIDDVVNISKCLFLLTFVIVAFLVEHIYLCRYHTVRILQRHGL